MATSSDVEVLRAANRGAVVLATRALEAFWGSLDLGRPEAVRDALLEYLPVLVEQYGEAAAVVAADWYDDLRAAEGLADGFTARMGEPVAVERVRSRVRFGAQHLFTENPGQTLVFLSSAVTRYVLEPGRVTVAESVRADPVAVGWHRETRGGGCGFCRMLAGRGAVYKRATANFAAHDDCHCVAVPSWDANAPEVPVDLYRASERTTGMTPEQKARHNALIRRAIDEYVD